MLDLIYLGLKKRLAAKLPELENIDWHLNQFEQVVGDDVVAAPGLYIRFLPIEWKTLGDNIQRGIQRFEAHLVSDSAYGDERDMTDREFIDHLRKDSLVFQALMNFRFNISYVPGMEALANTPNDMVLVESIVRVGSVPHSELTNLPRTAQAFQATVYDYSATPQWQTVLATLELEVTVGQPTAWQDAQGQSLEQQDGTDWLGED